MRQEGERMATLQEVQQATEESTSKYVQAGGISLHYNEIGTGDPILCLHGGGPGPRVGAISSRTSRTSRETTAYS